MAGLWSRLHNWVDDETLTNEDLNAEFNNVQANSIATEVEGYSSVNNVPNNGVMDSQVDPYPALSRSYATSVAGEIQRLRYMLASITGKTEWYNQPDSSIATLYTSLQSLIGAQSSPRNIVKSGAKSATNQPQILIPDGTARTIVAKCVVTPMVVDINGTQYTFSTDITLTGLTAAPSSNNTASVGTVTTYPWVGVNFDKYTGEDFTRLPITGAGSSITALVNQIVAMKVTHTAVDEYFIGLLESSTFMSKCYRGFFYDHSLTNIERVEASSTDAMVLMRLTYVFVKSDGTLDVTYTPLSYGSVSPSTPSSGDFWYDTSGLGEWKKYNGATFVSNNCALIGSCLQSTTATSVARTFPFFATYSDANSFDLDSSVDLKTIMSKNLGQKVSVAGNVFDFKWSMAQWSTTGNFASGVTFVANALYWLYVTDSGETIIDTRKPHDRSADLLGWYHPYNPWRCLGAAVANGAATAFAYFVTMGDMRIRQADLITGPTSPSGTSSVETDGFAISPQYDNDIANTTTYALLFSVTIRTSGRPTLLLLRSSQTGQSGISITGSGFIGTVAFTRDGDTSTGLLSEQVLAETTGTVTKIPPGSFNYVDIVPAGHHTYSVYAKVSNASANMVFSKVCLLVKEL